MKILKTSLFIVFLCFPVYLFALSGVRDTIKTENTDSISNDYKPNYSYIFRYQYPKALQFYISNKYQFDSICYVFQVDTAIAVSIVFPEFIRYVHYQDVIESLSLETVYVKLGKDFIDFSVGPMQMKPSFVEDLERILNSSPVLSLKYKVLREYHSVLEQDVRRERLDRMKSPVWQMMYICLFCDIVSTKFQSVIFNTKQQKIKFFAAAYNSDFKASADKISKQAYKRNFPDGKNSILPQYSYSDIALDFYKNHYQKLQHGY
jgi:hypothetical protein